jgi:hypothetical protein
MKLEIARQLEAQARQDSRITVQVQSSGRSWKMHLTLRSEHIGPRVITIRSARQWASVAQAWKGL